VAGTLIERIPRPLRFGFVGGTCAALQLGILFVLVHLGLEQHAANILAFLLSTQGNFVLSSSITWHERRGIAPTRSTAAARLASYNAMALGTLLVNQAVFTLAVHATHYLVASALGIVVAALLNYLVSGAVIFRYSRQVGGGAA
jgi:putative flippase GtrA